MYTLHVLLHVLLHILLHVLFLALDRGHTTLQRCATKQKGRKGDELKNDLSELFIISLVLTTHVYDTKQLLDYLMFWRVVVHIRQAIA